MHHSLAGELLSKTRHHFQVEIRKARTQKVLLQKRINQQMLDSRQE